MNYVRLEAAAGPECPHCGCRDAKILRHPNPVEPGQEPSWWGGGKARCNHCSREFVFRRAPEKVIPEEPLIPLDAEPAVMPMPVEKPAPVATYQKPKCPKCDGRSHVNGKHGRVRYHKCIECDHRFKSIEGEANER